MSAAPAAGGVAPRRRALDFPLRLVGGDLAAAPQSARVDAWRLSAHPGEASRLRAGVDTDAFLLDDGTGDEVLLLAGAEIRALPRGAGGRELLERAGRGAAAWRREQLRAARRLQLPERLIAYAEQLGRAQGAAAVHAALVEHAPRIAGGFCAVLFASPGEEVPLRPVETEPAPPRLAPVALPPSARLEHPCLITAADALADSGSPFTPLAPLFADLGACALASVPFDGGSVLFMVERRADRRFEPEDWDLLRAVTRQAEAALERVRLFDQVRELSLTDPLTGLANRRQLRLVLDRGLAAARRGEPLAVALLDLDDFRLVNERRGHLGGDRVLRAVAEALAAEVRGSDLVARYGGDEFVIVLPGGSAASAAILLRRVRERLDGQASLSVGVAEYGPELRTADALVEAADRDLYRAKRRAHGAAPAAVSIRHAGYDS